MASSLDDLRVPLTTLLLLLLSFLCAFPHELFHLLQTFLFEVFDRLLGGLTFLVCASAAIAVFSIFNSRQDSVTESEDEIHVSVAEGQSFVQKAVDGSISMEIECLSLPPSFDVANAMAEQEMKMQRLICENGMNATTQKREDDDDGEHIIENTHCGRSERDEDESYTIKNAHGSAPWFETGIGSMKKKKNPLIKHALGFKEHELDGDADIDDALNAMMTCDGDGGDVDVLNAMMMDDDALDDALVHEINKHGAHALEMRDMMMALMSPRELSKQADAFINKFKKQMRMQQLQSWKFTSNILVCSSALNMQLEHGFL